MINYISEEQNNYFINRTKDHIHRVQENLKRIYFVYPDILDKDIIKNKIKDHDNSKFSNEEYEGYVYISDKHRKDSNFELTDYKSEMMKNAWDHHKSNNRHHPEFHNNISDMTKEDLCEMVADWAAMSQELHDNLLDWVNKQINKYKFNNLQIKYIKMFASCFPELTKK